MSISDHRHTLAGLAILAVLLAADPAHAQGPLGGQPAGTSSATFLRRGVGARAKGRERSIWGLIFSLALGKRRTPPWPTTSRSGLRLPKPPGSLFPVSTARLSVLSPRLMFRSGVPFEPIENATQRLTTA